jgi:iron(III) transport system permease protein
MAHFLTPWRWAAALVLFLVAGLPLALPLADLALHGVSGWTAHDTNRVGHLLLNTILLIAGTLALALPVGTALAIVLFRTEFSGRRFLLACIVALLFVPLPMFTSAWQAFFGSDGWWRLRLWGENAGRPWTTGMLPAIWVHFLAGLPWVVLFVGLGLNWVERELEEDGLLLGPPWWVLWKLTLPRCRGAILFAGVWLALQTAAEISVTDMMLVNTFAEEVQTQFTAGDRGGVARAVLAALPLTIVTWGLLAWWVPRLERLLPPLQMRLAEPRRFSWGRWRWPALLVAALLIFTLAGLPLLSLLWKLGQSGHPPHWSAATAWAHFDKILSNKSDRGILWKSLLTSAAAGVIVGWFALILCWLADESTWLRRLLIVTLTLAWALPGPIVGIGLKESIAIVIRVDDMVEDVEAINVRGQGGEQQRQPGFVSQALYHGPSPLPLAWAYIVRFLPFAVALLWPIVRLVPREPREAARLEGQGPWREFWTVVWPLTRRGVLLCSVLVAALCLGEVAASTRVETPGWESFAKLLFDRMHYGVTNDVAALSLLLLGVIVLLGLVSMIVAPALRLRARSRGSTRINTD